MGKHSYSSTTTWR